MSGLEDRVTALENELRGELDGLRRAVEELRIMVGELLTTGSSHYRFAARKQSRAPRLRVEKGQAS